MEGVNSRKTTSLDWDAIFDGDDGDPPQLEIVKSAIKPPKPPPLMNIDQSTEDDVVSLTDHQLLDKMKSYRNIIENLSSKLPDNGERSRVRLKILEEEYRRREQVRAQKALDPCSNHIQFTRLDRTADGRKRKGACSGVNSQSEFASHFNRKIDGNKGHRVDTAFDKELSVLRRRDQQKARNRGATFQRKIKKDLPSSSSRESPFLCASGLSENGGKRDTHLKAKMSSTSESLSSCLMKNKYSSQASHSNGSSGKGQTIDLVDEDDTHVLMTDRENKIAASMKDKEIYYPSRDDPEAVIICYSDIDCLAPEGFLKSEIMNFYIRCLRLQMSPMNKALCDYHFFTTYFYTKLQQAVSPKVSEKESFFVKFRRWWKGVNIFEKAYIFIPIHEDLHWSLVIICNPDKEDKSGPIILHLDSLGLHSSKLVFEEIKSFLIQEWKYLNEAGSPLALPIDDHIWDNLPRRIDVKTIEVPQQRNDYDCGIFVLFFMERFIEEAPERLKKKDLAMFGKRWFRPEEASGLRARIRNILLDEFEKASVSNCISEYSSPSSDGSPP